MTAETLLEVQNLKKHFPVSQGLLRMKQTGWVKAVDGINFRLKRGETLGLVGESGCGKTTLANLILMLDHPTSGTVRFESRELTGMRGAELRQYKAKVQAVFQDPYSSLNPRMKVRNLLLEPMGISKTLSKRQQQDRVGELLSLVGLKEQDANLYPHEFSGGQRQRISIARALGPDPELIVLDEPVSALDVSIRSQIMNLLKRLQEKLNLTYLIIAHDLGVVKYMSNWVAVMYLGKIVELAASNQLYSRPMHPYTRALITSAAMVLPGQQQNETRLTGDIPSPLAVPQGCRLNTRCPHATKECLHDAPAFELKEHGHWVACHHVELLSNEQ